MAVKLSRTAYDHATKFIEARHVVLDERDDWSEHQPSAAAENEFIQQHGFQEYGHWFLGVDDSAGVETKRRYKYPYGDFSDVHRCGVLSAESRAAQNDHRDIQTAAAHLHGMLEALRT
jgi:hypothetical protein